jgi:large subunit ribosomal protein L10
MALSRNKKTEVVKDVVDLLDKSRMTVIAKYEGTDVKSLQSLRKDAKANATSVKVIKNRLFARALKESDKFKDISPKELNGMLLYAFNPEDEVAPAQVLNAFAKKHPNMQFIGAISAEGEYLDAASVKELASLPGKTQLIAGVISMLGSPIRQISSGLSGNLPALLQAIEAKAS